MRPSAPERKVIVVPDARTLAEAAAQRLIDRIVANPDRPRICLTGGSTPQRLYELLATPAWRERIPWTRVHWFMGDDRFVPHDDPLSNIGMARRAFLDACAPPQNIHAVAAAAASPDDAARRYEEVLKGFHPSPRDQDPPLFDLVLMGVGPDGHTASLFPGAPALAERQRWVVGVPHANVTPFVPRVSLTFPTLASTRDMLFMTTGADKRDIVARVFSGDDLPAARAASAKGETVWLLDKAAAPAEATRDHVR